MQNFKIVKTPTNIGGVYLNFGSIYGRAYDVTYNVTDYRIYTHGSACYFKIRVLKDGRWCKSTTLLHTALFEFIWNMLDKFNLWDAKITPFADRCAAPKMRKTRADDVFKVPYVGYALSSRVTTDKDSVRPYSGYISDPANGRGNSHSIAICERSAAYNARKRAR